MIQEKVSRRLGLYYFFYFCAIGILEPYLTLYLRHLGFSGRQIGLLAGTPGLIHAIFPFLWTAFADARSQRNRIFLLNTWASAFLFCLFLLTSQFGPLLLLILLFTVFRSPLIPLLNAFALHHCQEKGIDFARLRVWGSLGYIVAAILLGKWIDLRGPRVALYGGLAAFVLAGLAWGRGLAWTVERSGGFRKELGQLLRGPRLLVFLLCSLLAWMSWSSYSNFFTIHLEALGISKGLAGWAWALGVVSEVVLMFSWRRVASRFRPQDLFLLGLVLIAVRWFLYSVARSPMTILPIQLLHGVTFATFYLSSMAILDGLVPSRLRATSQGMYSALTFGLGSLLGGLGSGWLFDQFGMATLFRASSLVALGALWLYVFSLRRGSRLDRLEGGDGPGKGEA